MDLPKPWNMIVFTWMLVILIFIFVQLLFHQSLNAWKCNKIYIINILDSMTLFCLAPFITSEIRMWVSIKIQNVTDTRIRVLNIQIRVSDIQSQILVFNTWIRVSGSWIHFIFHELLLKRMRLVSHPSTFLTYQFWLAITIRQSSFQPSAYFLLYHAKFHLLLNVK